MKWGTQEPATRPLVAASARLGRRAHQPRGLDLVPPPHRRGPLPDRRHLVADRDRRDHGVTAPRGHHDEARVGDVPAAGISAEVVDDAGERVDVAAATSRSPNPGLDAAWDLGQPGALPRDLLGPLPRPLLRGDGAKVDEDGYLWVIGRVDDVMNVSGHRISTTEVESALVDDTRVAEAAVVGATDDTTGQAIVAFVTVKGDTAWTESLGEELRAHVADKIGKISRPRTIVFTDDLPKTRSGKIMRRLLRDVAEGRDLGDTTTLADPGVVDEIHERPRRSSRTDRGRPGVGRRLGCGQGKRTAALASYSALTRRYLARVTSPEARISSSWPRVERGPGRVPPRSAPSTTRRGRPLP